MDLGQNFTRVVFSSTAGNNTIRAAASGKFNYIHQIHVGSTALGDIKIKSGSVDLSGVISHTAGVALDIPFTSQVEGAVFRSSAGAALVFSSTLGGVHRGFAITSQSTY